MTHINSNYCKVMESRREKEVHVRADSFIAEEVIIAIGMVTTLVECEMIAVMVIVVAIEDQHHQQSTPPPPPTKVNESKVMKIQRIRRNLVAASIAIAIAIENQTNQRTMNKIK